MDTVLEPVWWWLFALAKAREIGRNHTVLFAELGAYMVPRRTVEEQAMQQDHRFTLTAFGHAQAHSLPGHVAPQVLWHVGQV